MTVLVFLVLLLLALAFVFLNKRRKSKIEDSNVGIKSPPEESANDDGSYLYINTETEQEEAPLPSHISLHKDVKLLEKAKYMANEIKILEEEFFKLVEYVNENVINEKNIATQGDNKEHNRYIDIG